MADEIVYRLIAGDGIQIVEDSGTKTATMSVPGLATKLNQGDIGQSSQVSAGIIEIATNAEVLSGTDTDRAVTPGGLASIAQINTTDNTANRLLRVGAFGLGANAVNLSAPNLNDERPSGFYYCFNNPVNSPLSSGYLLQEDNLSTGYVVQTFTQSDASRRWFRIQSGGSWGAWRELYHTGNFDPASKANTSGSYPGLDVGNAATVGSQTAVMLAPPGMIASFAMISAPNGWLKANGAAVSRSTYSALFAAIGTTFGSGNGSSTFNLPDMRGEFMRGWDDGRGVDSGRTLATVQGSQNLTHTHSASSDSQGSHTHTIDAVGNHQHAVAEYAGATPSSSHLSASTNSGNAGAVTGAAGAHTHTEQAAGSHAHNISVNSDGGTEARPRNIAMLVCIKT